MPDRLVGFGARCRPSERGSSCHLSMQREFGRWVRKEGRMMYSCEKGGLKDSRAESGVCPETEVSAVDFVVSCIVCIEALTKGED